MTHTFCGLHLPKKAVLFVLTCLLVGASLSMVQAQGQPPAPSTQEYKIYIPEVGRPFHVHVPLFFANALAFPASAARLQRHAPSAFVTRSGENLQLNGRPYTFIGINVSYLAGPFFPEDRTEEIISYLAGVGVQVIRVWVEPWCDLDRAERMLDLGGKYNVRFIITLQNFFGHTDGSWFKGDYAADLNHTRSIVSRFAQRPEVLMWELMNEPTCPTKDSGQDCWDGLCRWAQVTSREIKRLDSNHLVAVGTQRAGFYPQAVDAFRRMHALDTIDMISVHGEVGKLQQGEFEQEIALAHELGKPLYLGEMAMPGHKENCEPLPNQALQKRAQAIAMDIAQSLAAGFDGYLLWQYAYGRVETAGQVTYYCSVLDYFANDPVWKVIQAATAQTATE